MATKAATAHIPALLVEKIDELAVRLTREGMADVDSGLVIDHQAVQAWVAMAYPRCLSGWHERNQCQPGDILKILGVVGHQA